VELPKLTNREGFWTIVAGVVTLATAIVVVTWFIFELNAKVNSIDLRIRELPTQQSNPTINPSNTEATKAQTCADLAKSAVESYKRAAVLDARYTEAIMDKLGCTLKK
jgi:hypothetical protein